MTCRSHLTPLPLLAPHFNFNFNLKDAVARTDVPDNLVDLIKQRRRWLNGSFFATLFCLQNAGRLWEESNHSLGRKVRRISNGSLTAL